MPLNSSGPISLGGATTGESINLELGQSATQQVSLNDTNVRSLAGISVGAITMPIDFWGKSSATNKAYFFFNNNTFPLTNNWNNRILIVSGNDVLLFDTASATGLSYSGLSVTGTAYIFYKFNTQSETVTAQKAQSCSTSVGGTVNEGRLFLANNYFWTYGSARDNVSNVLCNTRTRWNWTNLTFETGQIWSASVAYSAVNDAGFFNADESGACMARMGNDIGWLITFNSAGARTNGTRLYGSSNATGFTGEKCVGAADGSIYVLGQGSTSGLRLTRHNGSSPATLLNSLAFEGTGTAGDFALSSTVSTTPPVYILQRTTGTNLCRISLVNNTLTSVTWGFNVDASGLSSDGAFSAQNCFCDSSGNVYFSATKTSTTTPSVQGLYLCKMNLSGNVLWQKLIRVVSPTPFSATQNSPLMRMLSPDEKQIYLNLHNILFNLDANGNIPAGTFTTTVLSKTYTITITNVSLTFTSNTTLPPTTSITGGALPSISTLVNRTWTNQSGLNVGDSALNIG